MSEEERNRLSRRLDELLNDPIPASCREVMSGFVKFDIFGSFLRLAVQRRCLKGFTLMEKGTLVSGTELKGGT
jgi:hypothetical protein